MPLYMLDTDICSYIMKRSDARVLEKLNAIYPGDVCLSTIVLSELKFGVRASPRRERDQTALDAFLRNTAVLHYPSEAAAEYAEIRVFLQSRGTLIGANDMLIAAHARCLKGILVTNNTREFRRVPNLKIENWTERPI